MRFNKMLVPVLLLPFVLLVGCGGGGASDWDDDGSTDTNTEDNTSNTNDTGASNNPGDGVSYLPLMVFERYKEYSGFDQDGVFRSDWDSPYIKAYLINPVDSATLLPVTTAQASNYKVTVDGVEISETESFPMLQRVIGAPVALRTALVFDISGSMVDVDIQQLVNEAKDYIATAQASTELYVASQEFTVWVFADEPEELTAGFTSDTATINTALDQVVTQYNTIAHGYGTSIHRAVVEAIGRFSDTDNDFSSDGDNDLVDIAHKGGVGMSHLVIFSSGSETALEFDEEEMTRAIESQGFLQYTGVSTSDTNYTRKPVFYYVVGGANPGVAYDDLSDVAEDTTNITLSGGQYTFAGGLIRDQIAAVARRFNFDNMWVYRFAFVPRVGDHTVVFSSNSTANSYTLTGDISGGDLNAATGSPREELTDGLIEIAGPNGEYISNALISFGDASTFTPTTRWTTEVYGASDYSWSITNGTGAENADGSYTVTSITAPATLTLTNTTIGGYQTQITIVD